MSKKQKIILIIMAVVALVVVVYGITIMFSRKELPKDFVIVTGKLKVISQAKDNALNLTGMGPVICRKAEMYQHIEQKSNSVKNYFTYDEPGFSNRPEEDFEAYVSNDEAWKNIYNGNGESKKFKNPKFPEEFLNDKYGGFWSEQAGIYGTVEIGDDGIRLDDSLLELFKKNESWDGLTEIHLDNCMIPAYETPQDAGKEYGLKLVGDGVYASRSDGNWEIGDMRITYEVIDPKVMEGEFTAVGKLSEDNVLYREDDKGALFDEKLTKEEVMDKMKSNRIAVGFSIVCKGIVGFISFFAFIMLCNMKVKKKVNKKLFRKKGLSEKVKIK